MDTRVTFKIKDQAFNYTYTTDIFMFPLNSKYAKCECHKGSPKHRKKISFKIPRILSMENVNCVQ